MPVLLPMIGYNRRVCCSRLAVDQSVGDIVLLLILFIKKKKRSIRSSGEMYNVCTTYAVRDFLHLIYCVDVVIGETLERRWCLRVL